MLRSRLQKYRPVSEVLEHEDRISESPLDCPSCDVLYLGRGTGYVLALEDALKLTEFSYLHAEGLRCRREEVGPIALIDEKVPVIVLAPSDSLFETIARGRRLVMISKSAGISRLEHRCAFGMALPD